MNIRDLPTIEKRRKFLKKTLNCELKNIACFPKDLDKAQYKNCENMIGAVQVPLGIAGPLKIFGEIAKGDYYLPLATTEGALVASVNRGCKAVTLSGGTKVFSENAGMTRGSVFQTKGLEEATQLKKWFSSHFNDIYHLSGETSSHLQLKDIEVAILGRSVFVRFSFFTMDAMGMNMVTIATDIIARFAAKETGSRCVALAGNFDVDKKPAWLNFIRGRGRKVWAEAVLPEKIIAEVLKTTPEKIHEVVVNKCYLGSIISGSLGFNAHFANVIAAIFIACGQDAAHTVEGSLGVTTTDIIDGKLYISVYLPDLPVGTVGGGTNLPTQREALGILGLGEGKKGEDAWAFAEIIAGAVLAGEISLLASLSDGSLAQAHQRLARNN